MTASFIKTKTVVRGLAIAGLTTMLLLTVMGGAGVGAASPAAAPGRVAPVALAADRGAVYGSALITYASIRGEHRYHTAQLISQAMFPTPLPEGAGVVLATGETFQQALCGAPLAAAWGGPVLLTYTAALDNGTKAELQRLDPAEVFCIGLSPAAVEQVRIALPVAKVTSIPGADVYEMSRNVANALEAKVGDMTGATAIITIGTNFPDAIGVAPLASARLWPVILTDKADGSELHASALGALTDLGITKALKVGTYATLPAAVLGVGNCSGADRYVTNLSVANWAKANAGLTFGHLGVAIGEKFPDALAAGPYLAADGGVLLLSPFYGPLPTATANAIASETPVVQRVTYLAMLDLVGQQVQDQLEGVAGDWPTYHHDAARSGASSDQGALGTVRTSWTTAEIDGRLIYAQPLVVGDQVLVATEGNTVVSLDAATGTVDWSTNLGTPVPRSDLPGGNIDPSGITGTPVVDVASGTLFVVAFLRDGPHHELFALDLATGTIDWHRAIDPPGLSALVEQQRPALTLTSERVYVSYGGLAGDLDQYKGAMVSAATDGTGTLDSYIVPTTRMGGLWNPTGPSVDSNGDLWTITGNTASLSAFDYGNAVLRLSPALSVLDYFAPTDWVNLNARDMDLNSLGQTLLPGSRVLAVGKTGMAYLLNATDLGHVSTALATVNIGWAPFGTTAAMGSRVFIPTAGGLVALDVSAAGLQIAWKVTGGTGSPVIAAGHVWTLTYGGLLKAVNPNTGTVVWSLQLSKPASRFVTLSAANGRVFVADGKKIVALSLR